MRQRRFIQCDVFSSVPARGNGLAVVVDATGLSDDQMQAFAAWTCLAETTFLLPPEDPQADYKVRIFTPQREMVFAGHPTLGSCASWLHCGGKPRNDTCVVQECGIGLVRIDMLGDLPAFLAPPVAVEPMDDEIAAEAIKRMGIDPARVVRRARLCNGPVWQAFELESAADVLAADGAALRYPEFVGIGLLGPCDIGLIGRHDNGASSHFEVRMLAPSSGMLEDPVTGSLNAALARWQVGLGNWSGSVVVAQGTKIGRFGRIHVRCDADNGEVWIGGNTQVLIEGTVTL